MKVCINLILFLGVVMTSSVRGQKPRRDESYPPKEFVARFKVFHDVCVQETGVAEAAIKEFSDGEIHDDQALKCYINCQFREMNVVDDDGELNIEKLDKFVPDDMKASLEQMFSGCNDPVGETQCDRAWWWHQCWKTNDPAHYFLP